MNGIDKRRRELRYNKRMKESGYVYIFTNPSMPEHIKIGYTTNIKRRLNDLDTTGIPMPFEPYLTVRTIKFRTLEKVIHRELDKLTDTRARTNREFFRIDPELARDLLLNISKLIDDAEIDDYGNKAGEDVVNEDGTVKPISSRTTFAMLNIPVGTELEPITDRYPRAVTIDNTNLVRLENGEEKAISRVAVDVTGHSRNGFMCYRYKGELLSDIRKRIDKNYLPSHQK